MSINQLCRDAIVSSIRRAMVPDPPSFPQAVFLSKDLIDSVEKETLDQLQFERFPMVNIVADYNLLGVTCYCFKPGKCYSLTP